MVGLFLTPTIDLPQTYHLWFNYQGNDMVYLWYIYGRSMVGLANRPTIVRRL